MEQEQAISLINNQISKISSLKRSQRYSSMHTKWGIETLQILEDIFGKSSRIFRNFNAISWSAKSPLLTRGFEDIRGQLNRQHQMVYLERLDTAKGVLEAGIALIQRKGIENVYEERNTSKESSKILKIISLLQNRLRKMVRTLPESEEEVNDAIENLFIGAELDGEFSREKIRFQYSSKSYTPDFVFEKISTVVEGKYSKNIDRRRQIIKEINDYIVAYKTRYNNLIFVVYDNQTIRNEDEFREDFELVEDVIVLVIKH